MRYNRSCILPVVLAIGTIAVGAEPPPQERGRLEPDHLVPVNPYLSENLYQYNKIVNDILKISIIERLEMFQVYKRGTITMVRRSSFRPEEFVALREENGARDYNLYYTGARQSIWDSIPEDGKEAEPVRIKIVESTKPIDKVRAQRIYGIWERMLMEVRYPEGGPRAHCPDDGETLEFRYPWKGMYGETCSPTRRGPKLLADLSDSMISCCRALKKDQDENFKILDNKCAEIESYLDKKGKLLNRLEKASDLPPTR